MGALYNQVADQLQALIADGVYRAGDRLPGVRALSRQFGVSISTVLQAHQTLEARARTLPRLGVLKRHLRHREDGAHHLLHDDERPLVVVPLTEDPRVEHRQR